MIALYKNLKEEKKMEELNIMNLERNEDQEVRDKEELRRKMEVEQHERKAKLIDWKDKKAREKQEE